MTAVIYLGDVRYPAPHVHPPPAQIRGIPTQEELDAFPRMFTWGELKEIVKSGDLERLGRNYALQRRYDVWTTAIKKKYGSTENYLSSVRLPWPKAEAAAAAVEPTYNPDPTLAVQVEPPLASSVATPLRAESGKGKSPLASGTSTPLSAGFVSLSSLKLVNGKLRTASGSTTPASPTRAQPQPQSQAQPQPGSPDSKAAAAAEQVDGEEGEGAGEDGDGGEYMKYDPSKGFDTTKYAVLANDWPYNTPYGVRHYCVWSKVPIAHPELVEYDPAAWARIELEGLSGFTGVPSNVPGKRDDGAMLEIELPSGEKTTVPLYGSGPGATGRGALVNGNGGSEGGGGAVLPPSVERLAGKEAQFWAGVQHQTPGGQHVGAMVRALWDERGWECLWFINPPHLQSVPSFSHFHVFARRKTPEEIDRAEQQGRPAP